MQPAAPLALILALLQAAPAEPLYLTTCHIPLPTAAEVENYVQRNWPDYEDRLSPQPVAAPRLWALVKVRDVRCDYVYSAPYCDFVVVARRSSGELASAQVQTSFARNQHGELAAEVIVTGEDPACRRRTQPDG